MQQPDLFAAPSPAPAAPPRDEMTDRLYNRLIKLGDLLSDHVDDPAFCKEVGREYRAVAKALGLIKSTPRRNHAPMINASVAKYLETARCDCGGQLVQTRSGAKRAECVSCRKKYQLSSKPSKSAAAGA